MTIKLPWMLLHSTVTKTTLADQAMSKALWKNIEVTNRQDASLPCHIFRCQPYQLNAASLQIKVQTQTRDFSVSWKKGSMLGLLISVPVSKCLRSISAAMINTDANQPGELRHLILESTINRSWEGAQVNLKSGTDENHSYLLAYSA